MANIPNRKKLLDAEASIFAGEMNLRPADVVLEKQRRDKVVGSVAKTAASKTLAGIVPPTPGPSPVQGLLSLPVLPEDAPLPSLKATLDRAAQAKASVVLPKAKKAFIGGTSDARLSEISGLQKPVTSVRGIKATKDTLLPDAISYVSKNASKLLPKIADFLQSDEGNASLNIVAQGLLGPTAQIKPIPRGVANTLAATIVRTPEFVLGIPMGVGMAFADPKDAVVEGARSWFNYYRHFATESQKQGLLQPVLDVLTGGEAALTAVARGSALKKTVAGVAEGVVPKASIGRSVLFGQEPIDIGGVVAMRKPVTVRETKRPVPLTDLEAIPGNAKIVLDVDGKKVRLRKPPENIVGSTIVDEFGVKNQFDWNNKKVTVDSASVDQRIAQRLVPDSRVGAVASDIYESVASSIPVWQKGYQTKALRSEMEFITSRLFSDLKAFASKSKKFAKDPVADAAFVAVSDFGVDAIANQQKLIDTKISRGFNKTKQQIEDIAILQASIDFLKNPPSGFLESVVDGRKIADQTTDALLSIGGLTPDSAKSGLSGTLSWMADNSPVQSSLRQPIVDALVNRIGEKPAYIVSQIMDSAARAKGLREGVDPVVAYDSLFKVPDANSGIPINQVVDFVSKDLDPTFNSMFVRGDTPSDVVLNMSNPNFANVFRQVMSSVMDDHIKKLVDSGDERVQRIKENARANQSKDMFLNNPSFRARVVEKWFADGGLSQNQSKQLRQDGIDLLSDVYLKRIEKPAESQKQLESINSALKDEDVASIINESLDITYGVKPSEGSFFITEKDLTSNFFKSVASINSPKKRKIYRNEKVKLELGLRSNGYESVIHYATQAVRDAAQRKVFSDINKFSEPLTKVNGKYSLKDGYVLYNPYGVNRVSSILNNQIKLTNDRESLYTDGILDMSPEEFTFHVNDIVGDAEVHVFPQNIKDLQNFFGDIEKFDNYAASEKIGQIPVDVKDIAINSIKTGFVLERASTVKQAIVFMLGIPSMKARWNMITRPAYATTNAASTTLLAAVDSPVFFLHNLLKSVRLVGDLSKETVARLAEDVGSGTSDIYGTNQPLVGANQNVVNQGLSLEKRAFRATQNFMTAPERRVRIAAIYDQYRKFGLKTDKQINDFFELSKTDQRISDIRNQLAYNAENTVVRFRGVDPQTAFVFRNMAFVAGWLRAATRYSIKYPLDHPVLANVGFNLGQQGWEKARDIISEVPRELEGAIPLPDKYKKDIIRFIDPNKLLPASTAIDVWNAIKNSASGNTDSAWYLANLLDPGVENGINIIYGKDPRFGTSWLDGIVSDFKPENLPVAGWVMRFLDPSLTETLLKNKSSRSTVLALWLAGTSGVPVEYKKSAVYARWLKALPQSLRTMITNSNEYEDQINKLESKNADGSSRWGFSDEAISLIKKAFVAQSAYDTARSLIDSATNKSRGGVVPNKDNQYGTALLKTYKFYYPEDSNNLDEFLISGLSSYDGPFDKLTYARMLVEDYWNKTVGKTKSDFTNSLNKFYADNGIVPSEAPVSAPNAFKRGTDWVASLSPDNRTVVVAAVDARVKKDGLSYRNPNDRSEIADIISSEQRKYVNP